LRFEHGDIRVLIVDSRPVVRFGLSSLLRSEPGIVHVDEAEDLSEAYTIAQTSQPTIVLMEFLRPHDCFVDAVSTFEQKYHARCLAFDDREDWSVVAIWLRAGGAGYLSQKASKAEILKAIRRVAWGGTYLSALSGQKQQPESFKDTIPLSEREMEVIALVASGYTASKIAEMLKISPKTIETYRSRIAKKLGIRARAELVHYAAECGLLRISGPLKDTSQP